MLFQALVKRLTKIKIFRNPLVVSSGFYLLSKIFPALSQVFSILFLSKILSSTKYGEYSTFLAFSLIFVQFFSTWLVQSILRYSNDVKLREIFIILGICSALASSFFYFFVCLCLDTEIITSVVFSLYIFSEVIFQILYASLQSRELIFKILVLEGSRAIILVFLLISGNIFLLEIPSFLPIIAFVIANTISAIITGNILRLKNFQVFLEFRSKLTEKKKEIKTFLSFGGSLTVFSTLSLVLIYFDRLIMPTLSSKESTGVYILIYDLCSKIMGFALSPILLAAHPILSRYWSENNFIQFASIRKKAIFLQVALGTSIIFAGSLLLNAFIQMFPQYKIIQYNEIASLLILFTGLVVQVNQILHKNFEFAGEIKFMILAMMVSLLVNILGNLVFIKQYGLLAASTMSIVSTITYSALIIFKRKV